MIEVHSYIEVLSWLYGRYANLAYMCGCIVCMAWRHRFSGGWWQCL